MMKSYLCPKNSCQCNLLHERWRFIILTDANIDDVHDKWLNTHEIIRNDRQIMSIDPELVRQKS